jgi:hypothetical protein
MSGKTASTSPRGPTDKSQYLITLLPLETLYRLGPDVRGTKR